MYSAGVNNEVDEPNTPEGKEFAYPYYYDADAGYYTMIVGEPLAATNTYPDEEANYTIKNNTVTDDDATSYSFGKLSWDDDLLNGVGAETLSPSQFSLELDGEPYSPYSGPHNINNEFGWGVRFDIVEVTGEGLTFIDGQLTDINISVQLSIVIFGNVNGFKPESTPAFSGLISFANGRFVHNVNHTQTIIAPVVGPIEDAKLYSNAQGDIKNLYAPVVDTDTDGASDEWELENGFDPDVTDDWQVLDSDNDGVTDIAETYFGTARNLATSVFQPTTTVSAGGELLVILRRSTQQSAVQATPYWSNDLNQWAASGESLNGVTIDLSEAIYETGSDYELVEITLNITVGVAEEIFLRWIFSPNE
ncbi:hypothetical protein [Cerasicoccus frondis]|uniref:hypothetical protein n=1 Tax=Cerasicoccus frondis TaxID=490090 RepID=UPI0028525D3B|nr:hypothetical protein [Cerasicoccus frondis]